MRTLDTGTVHCTPVTVVLSCFLRGLIPDVSHNTEHWLVRKVPEPVRLFLLYWSREPDDVGQVFNIQTLVEIVRRGSVGSLQY